MRVLCVAEKPSISKSITQILSGGRFDTVCISLSTKFVTAPEILLTAKHSTGSVFIKNYEFDYPQTNSNFIVTCVSGHLTEHDFGEAHRKWHSCNPAELFDAPVESRVAKDKKAIEQNLMAQARRADTLMIWTDCDREGEHIGMEIVGVCRKAKPNIVVKRARFSAIIAQQIHRAAQHPVELDQAQADAVEARILLDLKVGAAFTRMQTLSLQPQFRVLSENIVSYGPCQFPTLGFVVQKYNQVKNFVPEVFWYIHLTHVSNTSDGPQETRFNWSRGHIFDEPAASAIYEHVMQSQGARVGRNIMARVTKVTNKDTKKWKPLPLTTVELQKAGSRLLRMAPKKVLDVAEKLYQQGFLSYPRTETDQFDPQFDFMSLIHKQTIDPAWGNFARSLEQGGFSTPRKGKHDDNAHPPIHPTAHAGGLTGDEKKVYEYVARRFLACCSKDAEGWQTTVEVVCNGELFSASGLVILQRNYLDVYPYDKWSDHPLPEFKEGDQFLPASLELRNGETTKPHLLTEADLVTLMDKNGIGTDATIAQHIQNIIDREYVIERMEGQTKYLVPSTLGVALVEGYDKIGLDRSVSKPQLRRETERRMVQVCQRSVTKQDMLWQSLQQYKEMFRHVKDNWGTVVQVSDDLVLSDYLAQVSSRVSDNIWRVTEVMELLVRVISVDQEMAVVVMAAMEVEAVETAEAEEAEEAEEETLEEVEVLVVVAGEEEQEVLVLLRQREAGEDALAVPTLLFPKCQILTWMMSGPTARQVQPKTTSKSTTTASRVTMAPPATPPYPSSSSTARWTPSSSAIASSSPNPNPAQGVLCSCGLPAAKTTVQSGVNSAGKPCYVPVTTQRNPREYVNAVLTGFCAHVERRESTTEDYFGNVGIGRKKVIVISLNGMMSHRDRLVLSGVLVAEVVVAEVLLDLESVLIVIKRDIGQRIVQRDPKDHGALERRRTTLLRM
ncbi:hypothetical protein NP233_g5996 [Leucocoprinus birnbaumii]|uniref:DNA topoisomerase n=1 Tax=Leucocoprinus birnbaumii TaxID=56174 RepID=A0AAD5VT27_9AGAR|nr:hypothetical protein NP233_g5996 [Leucocoprinus birnbaumii]